MNAAACAHVNVTCRMNREKIDGDVKNFGPSLVIQIRQSTHFVMITVTFRAVDGKTIETSVSKFVALRDLQRDLCSFFGARFPAMQANVEVEGRIYEAFDDVPFANCGHVCACEGEREPQTTSTCGAKAEAAVIFEPTTDLYFFDQADRRGPKHTLEEEVAYEEAAKLGETSLNFQSGCKFGVTETGWPTVEQFPV